MSGGGEHGLGFFMAIIFLAGNFLSQALTAYGHFRNGNVHS